MIFAKNFARNYEKKIILGNIRHLVDESFIPATQHIVLKIVGFYYGTNVQVQDHIFIVFLW